jgi:hypothetical protein
MELAADEMLAKIKLGSEDNIQSDVADNLMTSM